MPEHADHDAVDGHVLGRDPIEPGAFPTPVAQRPLDAQRGIEHPLPDHAAGHERHGERIQVQRSKEAFELHFLIDEDREQESQRKGAADEEQAEQARVDQGRRPAVGREQIDVLGQAGPVGARQHLGVGKGDADGPEDGRDVGDEHRRAHGQQRPMRRPGCPRTLAWLLHRIVSSAGALDLTLR